MRSGAAAGYSGFFHEAAFYSSDDELLDIVVPFLRDGVANGEPAVVAFAERNATLTRNALGDVDGVTFLPGGDQYGRPASTIRSYLELFEDLASTGAEQIRVVGDVPHPGTGCSWHGWARYEAAVNRAFDSLPVWGMCPYDTRTTPDHVLTDVAETHRHLADGDGRHTINGAYRDPAALLAGWIDRQVERPAPDEVIFEPTAKDARDLARHTARQAALGAVRSDSLVVSVSELVTNASLHGTSPVCLEISSAPGRVHVAVTDRGPGPSDPFAGLLAPEP
ncbi:MAG: anti-sigma factor RsbA family regulatory protein, partial [Ilumatobacteraceae bacterium]